MDYVEELYLLNNLDSLKNIEYLSKEDKEIYGKLKKELEDIESKLKLLVKKDKENWVAFYILIKNVQNKNLCKIEGYNSFTAWLKAFCTQNKINELTAWNRLAAGNAYEEYRKRQKKNGIEEKNIQDIDVSMNSLLLIKKIESSLDGEAQDTLIKKALNKELTTRNLRETYKIIREKKENSDTQEINNIMNINHKISSTHIVSLLVKPDWLEGVVLKKLDLKRKYFKSFIDTNKYKAYTEFPIFTDSSQKSKCLDLLIVENIATEHAWDLHIHGIEIKISKSDFLKDQKYLEYIKFVHYLWLAIPEDLIEIALENKFKGCGIISIRDNTIKIVKEATTLHPNLIETTLSNIILTSI